MKTRWFSLVALIPALATSGASGPSSPTGCWQRAGAARFEKPTVAKASPGRLTQFTAAVYYAYEWVAGLQPPEAKPAPVARPKEVRPPAVPTPPLTPPAGRPDLHIDPDSIALFHTGFNSPDWWPTGGGSRDLKTVAEPLADQQALTVQISNRSATVPAKNVQLEIFTQLAGRSERTPTATVGVGDIAPNDEVQARTLLDLEGRNVEPATLFARVFTPGAEDLNAGDHEPGVEFSLYFSAQAGRAYSLRRDSHGFRNFGFDDRVREELLEGLLTALVGGVRLDSDTLAVLQRLWFASTYADFGFIATRRAILQVDFPHISCLDRPRRPSPETNS